VLKRGQNKAQLIVVRPEKKPNIVCGIAIPLSHKTSKLQEYPTKYSPRWV